MKKVLFMALTALFCFSTASAQKTVIAQKDQKVYEYDKLEKQPEFPGGTNALVSYLQKNVKYPADAQKQKIEGNVVVSFVIEADGSVGEAKVIKKAFPSLDAEALRIVTAMPKWKPGTVNGQPVRVKFAFPVSFRL